MYKNKDKQREANRQAKARQRAKGMTKDVSVIPEQPNNVIPKPVTVTLLSLKSKPVYKFGGELTKDRQLSGKGFNDGRIP